MASRKLTVEVCNAKNLMPKDGQGTASAYVQVDYDGQRRCTKTISRDLNPQWDEKLEFLVHDAESMAAETLELNVYNDKKTTGNSSTFLGKVKISGTTFVKGGADNEVPLVYYPLEKRNLFSLVQGEIGLKVSYVDEEPPPPPPPEKIDAAAPPPLAAEEKPPEEEKKPPEAVAEENKKEEEKNEDEKKPEEAAAADKKDEKPTENNAAAAPAEVGE